MNESRATDSAFQRKQESSVRHLQQLYTIVTGLALSDAISTLFREDIPRSDQLPVGALLLAFIATLIPFFHGAMRHLDEAYLLNEDVYLYRNGALAVDFVFLFLQGVLLFLLAHWLTYPDRFAKALLSLLIIDIVWALLLQQSSPSPNAATDKWMKNNLLFVPIIALAWFGTDSLVAPETRLDIYLLGAAAVVRTARDYKRSWSFYFPSPEAEVTLLMPTRKAEKAAQTLAHRVVAFAQSTTKRWRS